MFTEDPMDGYEINSGNERNKTVDVLNAYLPSLGANIIIDYNKEENNKKEEDTEYGDVDIPDYIKDMFKD